MLNSKIITITALLLLAMPAQAQEVNKPIEISADQTLEWNQKKNQYTANGNVVVTQGTLILKADQIIADYHDDDSKQEKTESGPNIWQLTAIGNVEIIDTGRTLFCDKAIYNVETESAVATGEDLKLKTDDMTVTARDKMTYDAKNNIAKAIGNAHLTKGTDNIYGQTLSANLIKGSDGKLSLQSAKAKTKVKIQTPEETLTGDNGVYNVQNDTATMTGNVTISRGENKLHGSKATLNLKTGISKMFAGSKDTSSRVRGIFYPGSSPIDNNSKK